MLRGQGNQRSVWLYFALSSEQAVNLCGLILASATFVCPWRTASHASALCTSSLLLPPTQFRSPWLNGGGGCRLNYSLHSFSPEFAFICTVLSLLFCCVCFLSGSHSWSVTACCTILDQLWHWSAVLVIQNRNRPFIGVQAHLQKWLPGNCFTHALCSVVYLLVAVDSHTCGWEIWSKLAFQKTIDVTIFRAAA